MNFQSETETEATLPDHAYAKLTPDTVLDAVESLGILTDARMLALNSYENRVFQVGIEEGTPIIAKFYRPERWSSEQILEEHRFSQELKDTDLSVVAPLQFSNTSLFEYQGFQFSLYTRQGGQAPELDNFDNLLVLGRTLGRMHQVARSSQFQHRPELSIDSFGEQSRDFLLSHNFIPQSLIEAYDTLTADLLKHCRILFERTEYEVIRCHGDCHIGNILWRDDTAHFVDFDDARTAPAIQDLWMLLSGDRANQTAQISELLEGYREFCDFNAAELNLIEALRTLRLMHYSAWLARRWQDPAFPMHFPWFNTERYWAEHILELREQLSALQEPPLVVY